MTKRMYYCNRSNRIVLDVPENAPNRVCLDLSDVCFEDCKNCHDMISSTVIFDNENIITSLKYIDGKFVSVKCCTFREDVHEINVFSRNVESDLPIEDAHDSYAQKPTETSKTVSKIDCKCKCVEKSKTTTKESKKLDKSLRKERNNQLPKSPVFDTTTKKNPRYSVEENDLLRLCPTVKDARIKYYNKYGNVRTDKSIENQYYHIKDDVGILKPGMQFVVTQRTNLLCNKVVTIDTISEGNNYIFVRDGSGSRISVEIKYLKKV